VRAGTLARRYAKALLDLAVEQGQLDRVGRDLNSLLETWNGSRELRQVFENPAIGAAHRKQVVTKIVERLGVTPTVRNALLMLSDRRRLRYLPEIAEAYQQLAEERAGRIRAEVVTAAPMPEKYFIELQKTLESVTGKEVVLVRKQDESLIGGVVTRVGDKVFDGSLRSRLDELKENLLTT
jgi:F-type H+-transporting ATPase subunit delta